MYIKLLQGVLMSARVVYSIITMVVLEVLSVILLAQRGTPLTLSLLDATQHIVLSTQVIILH